jgi:membrane associated rhomboid family serine protease
MTLRTVAREIKDYPATAFFSLVWVIVFVAMSVLWVREDPFPAWWRFLVLGMSEGHRFGDLTLAELLRGQIWRVITCNFVHYSVIHIALNLLAFYLLGTLVESWYGSSQFIMIYVVTGGLGNLVSAFIRHTIGSNPNIHSGGGSVVIMGLIGLCAMVGWRSRSARGLELGASMAKALGLTALLGLAFRSYIDNWGHAGGALVGFPLGLLDKWFVRQYGRPSAWGLGVLMSLVLAASALAQVAADRREAPARSLFAGYVQRRGYDDANRSLGVVALLGERIVDPRFVIQSMGNERTRELLDGGATRQPYRQALGLAQAALVRRLNDDEQAEFDKCLGQLSTQLLLRYAPLFNRHSTRADFDKLRVLAAQAQTRVLADQEKDEFKERLAPLKGVVHRELQTLVRELWQQQQQQTRRRARAG